MRAKVGTQPIFRPVLTVQTTQWNEIKIDADFHGVTPSQFLMGLHRMYQAALAEQEEPILKELDKCLELLS